MTDEFYLFKNIMKVSRSFAQDKIRRLEWEISKLEATNEEKPELQRITQEKINNSRELIGRLKRVIYMEGILHDNTIQILNNNISTEELEMLAVVSLMNSSQNFNVKGLKELLSKLKIKLPAIKLDDFMNGIKSP